MKKKLAALALSSTLLVGVVTGCAAGKKEEEPKQESKKEKSLPERRGVKIWAMKGKTEEYYEAKDIKEYYRSNKSGVLVITFKNGHEVQVTNYHLEEDHPDEN